MDHTLIGFWIFGAFSMFIGGVALGESIGRTRERKQLIEDLKNMRL